MNSFAFSEEIIETFTEEYCWLLAKMLQERIGGSIYGITDFHLSPNITKPPCGSEPLHYVLTYQDSFLDIRGLWSEESLLTDWRNAMVEMSARNKVFGYKLTFVEPGALPNYQVPREIMESAKEAVEQIITKLP